MLSVLFLITVVGSLIQAQQPITPSSNCYIGNITQGFGYDSNFEETGQYQVIASPSGAVGTNRLVATINRLIEVRKKDGTLMFRASLVDFFSSINTNPNVTIVFEPKVIYDEFERRFVVLGHAFSRSPQVSRLLLAVSKNETPDTMSAWIFSGFNSSVTVNGKPSYTNVSGFVVDKEVIYINPILFTFATNAYNEQRLWIVNKGVIGGLYGGGTAFVHGPYNPFQEANGISTYGTASKIHGSGGVGGSIGTYMVSLLSPPTTTVMQLITISSPMNTPPTFAGLNIIDLRRLIIPFLTYPPQNGSSTGIDIRYETSLDAVWRNNKLYFTAIFNPRSGVDANQITVFWARLNTTGAIVKLKAQGFLGGESFSPGTHTYYPAIDVNQQGYVGFGYVASSPTLYVGAYGSLLSGAVEQPFTVQSGLDVYRRRSSNVNVNSFGYYSSITVDPTDDSFWIFNQFADIRGSPDNYTGDDGRWGTVWARVHCTAPPPPTNSPTKPPTGNPTRAPIRSPTKIPTPTPTKAPVVPTNTSTKIPSKVPTKSPIKITISPPTKAPTRNDCGLFRLNIFCPFTGCGVLGRFFGLC